MIDDSDHPFVAAARKYTDDANAPREQVEGRDLIDFVGLHPATRVQTLQQLDALIQADDGSSLRQKAKLLNMSRTLSDTHTALRRAGR